MRTVRRLEQNMRPLGKIGLVGLLSPIQSSLGLQGSLRPIANVGPLDSTEPLVLTSNVFEPLRYFIIPFHQGYCEHLGQQKFL